MRLRISLVEVYERVGKLVISVYTLYMKGPKGANGKYGCEKVERKTLFCDLFIKDCIYSSENGCKVLSKVCEWVKIIFVQKRDMKGVPFLSRSG